MMKWVPDRACLLAGVLLLSSACAFVTTDPEPENSSNVQQDLRQLSAIRTAFHRAMTQGGLEEWVRSHLDSGVAVMPPGRPTISSNEEVSIWIRGLLEEHRVHHFALTTEEMVSGDWAFVWGVYFLEWNSSAGAKSGERGKVLFVCKRSPEGWKGAYVSFNSDGYWP